MKQRTILVGLIFLVMLMLPVSGEFVPSTPTMAVKQPVSTLSDYEVHNPIVIESNEDFETQGWPGDGTIENPYVIDGVSIVSNTTCINVTGVTVSFVIENSYINLIRNETWWTTTGIFLGSTGIVRNTTIVAPFGLWVTASDSIVERNTFFDCNWAVSVENADRTNITANQINGATENGGGIEVLHSEGCLFNENVITVIDRGIVVDECSHNNIISDNVITGNQRLSGDYNLMINNTLSLFLEIGGYCNEIVNNVINGNIRLEGRACVINDNDLKGFFHSQGYISYDDWPSMSGNMVNGKPLLFLKDSEKEVLDKVVDYGQIILLNCSDVVIMNSVLTAPTIIGHNTNVTVINNTIDALVFSSSLFARGLVFMCVKNSQIRDNVIVDSGILLQHSYNFIIANNSIANTNEGIFAIFCHHITLELNEIKNCMKGMRLEFITYSNVTYNIVEDCSWLGIYLWRQYSVPTTINITWNDFINAYVRERIEQEEEGLPMANYECNYWSDYEGEDLDGDGFGDTAYNVGWNTGAVDNRPRMFPLFDESPPVIIAPEDLTYNEGDTNNYINWSAIDANPSSYSIYFEGELLYAGLWNSSSEILSINVDGLTLGIYNYTIIFEDGMGYSSTDTVYVEVVDGTPPVLTHPNDLTYSEGSTGHTVSWQGTENYPSHYEVFKNGFIHWFGPWNSSSEMISVGVDGLGVGVHNFTIIIYDTSGNSNHDSVFVTVVAGTSTTTPTTTTDTTPTTTGDPTTNGADISIALAVGGTLLAIVVIIVLPKKRQALKAKAWEKRMNYTEKLCL